MAAPIPWREPDTATVLSEDGKRYRAKVAGAPFTTISGVVGATMSCWVCGRHALRQLGGFRRLLGATRFVCPDHVGRTAAHA